MIRTSERRTSRSGAPGLGCALALIVLACGPRSAPSPAVGEGGVPATWWREAGPDEAPGFIHFNGMSGGLFLAEITCGAGALFDADGDGDLDAFFGQGEMLGPGRKAADALFRPRHDPPFADRLYRNDLTRGPDGAPVPRFADVTASAIPPGREAGDGYTCAVAAGDIDGDGLTDLFVGNLGPDRLLYNRGGVFEDRTAGSGLGDPRNTTAATFFDYDRDGDLDLFVGHYATFDNTGATACRDLAGAADYCGPGAYPAEQDALYRNRGDGTFEDVTAAAGLTAVPARPTLGVVAVDVDGDGWLDLYVANDGQPNHLWMNRRDGTFREDALLAGAAVDGDGAAEAGMGVDSADPDGDGDFDLWVVHLVGETNTLYENDGRGLFVDATQATGLGPPSLPFTSFGTGFADFDGDSWLDLFVANGAVTRVAEQVAAGDPFPLRQTNQLFRNLGFQGAPGRFEEVTATLGGPALARSEVSRGTAFGDVDGDGDVDLLVINNNGPARLLINEAGSRRPWTGLRLVTGEPPRDALGAVSTLVRRDAPPLVRRVRTDGSYAAASDPRVLIGLGDRPEIEALRVRWPDGTEEEFPAPPVGSYSTVRQGTGERRAG